MDHDIKALTRDALELPANERAALAEALLTSLDEIAPEIEAAWAAEAEDRLDAYLRGDLTTVAVGDALFQTRSSLWRSCT